MKSNANLPRLLLFFFICSVAYTLPDSPSDDAKLTSARVLFKQGKFQDAAAAYRAILEKDRSSAPAYAGLVQSYVKADDVVAADEASGRAMTALPQSALVHAVHADVYFRKGLLAEAEAEYRTALKLDDKCARARLGMGKILSAVSDSTHAKEYFTKAHEFDPDDGDALYHWAVLLPYPQNVSELEKHLSEYHSSPEEERRERQFVELVRGIGDREVWVGPKDTPENAIKLELLTPRPGTILGLGMRVKFNNTVNATLLLDTGTSWMTIPRKLAEKLGARKISDYAIEGVGDSGPGGGYFAWVDKITVGDVEFHDCVVHVTLKSNAAGVDGIAGTNIFSKYQVTIDFPRRELRLAQLPPSISAVGDLAVHPVTEGHAGTPFSFGHIMLLSTLVNHSLAGLFVLDSGANISSISPQMAQKLGKLQETANRVAGSSGAINKVSVLGDAVLEFSGAPEPKRDLAAFDPGSLSRQLGTEVSGFIGFDVLSRMKLRIDYRDGVVEF